MQQSRAAVRFKRRCCMRVCYGSLTMRVFPAHRLGICIAACAWSLFATTAHASESEALGPDKALHYTVSVGLTLGASLAFDAIGVDEPASLPLSIGFALAMGVGKEAFDAIGGSGFSAADLTWDVLGIGTAMFLRVLVHAIFRIEPKPARAQTANRRLTSF
jgi:uncharacterized protein YfiM (DUF2279 family)